MPGSTEQTSAPPPVVLSRALGYLGFALLAGTVAVTLFCAPELRSNGRAQTVARTGIVMGAAATLAGLLVQGPYVAGLPFSRIGDSTLVHLTMDTTFGYWMAWRLAGYAAVSLLAWRLSWLEARTSQWPVAVLVVGLAATFSRTGHGRAPEAALPFVDTVHVLCAGIWVGGLVLLCVVGASGATAALPRFSRLALVTVTVLLATGVVNAVLHLQAVDELWTSRYGRLLSLKLVLVALAVGAAYVSRRTLGDRGSPWRSVRVEAALTVAILAVTAVLSLTSPPPGAATETHATGSVTHL